MKPKALSKPDLIIRNYICRPQIALLVSGYRSRPLTWAAFIPVKSLDRLRQYHGFKSEPCVLKVTLS